MCMCTYGNDTVHVTPVHENLFFTPFGETFSHACNFYLLQCHMTAPLPALSYGYYWIVKFMVSIILNCHICGIHMQGIVKFT